MESLPKQFNTSKKITRKIIVLLFLTFFIAYFSRALIQIACPPEAINFVSSTVEASTFILLIETLVRTFESGSS
jgi:hypothetical protein